MEQTQTIIAQEFPLVTEPWLTIPRDVVTRVKAKICIEKSDIPDEGKNDYRKNVSDWLSYNPTPKRELLARSAENRISDAIAGVPWQFNPLIFSGNTGQGKTRLACAMLYEIASAGHEVYFWPWHKITERIKKSWAKDEDGRSICSAFDPVDEIHGLRALCIDDVTPPNPERGKGPSVWELDTLRSILNAAIESGTYLILTCQMIREQMREYLHDATIMRRIYEDGREIVF